MEQTKINTEITQQLTEIYSTIAKAECELIKLLQQQEPGGADIICNKVQDAFCGALDTCLNAIGAAYQTAVAEAVNEDNEVTIWAKPDRPTQSL